MYLIQVEKYIIKDFWKKKITDKLGIGVQINKKNPVRLYSKSSFTTTIILNAEQFEQFPQGKKHLILYTLPKMDDEHLLGFRRNKQPCAIS